MPPLQPLAFHLLANFAFPSPFSLDLLIMQPFSTPQQYVMYVTLIFEMLSTTCSFVRLFKQRRTTAYPPLLPLNMIYRRTFVIAMVLSFIVLLGATFSFAILSWTDAAPWPTYLLATLSFSTMTREVRTKAALCWADMH